MIQLPVGYNYSEYHNRRYNRYDHIFYLVPEFSLEDDGVRSTNLKFRDDIVDLFDHYIKEYKIPVTKLTGTVEQRLNKIKETIK